MRKNGLSKQIKIGKNDFLYAENFKKQENGHIRIAIFE